MSVPLARQIIIATFYKLLLNIGKRFVYPFAPALSRGLDVPLSAVTSLIATGQISSFVGIFCGPLADRIGYRPVMQAGLGLLAFGMLICALFPLYWFVFLGLVMASLGKIVFDPAFQAYVGAKVEYGKRARVIGITEIAWAGSTLVGIPLLGIAIEYGGLHTAYYSLTILGFVAFFSIGKVFPPDTQRTKSVWSQKSFFKSLARIIFLRPVLGMLIFGFWISIANDNLFVVYGLWFERDFKVTLILLGFSTVAIGFAELLGESLTAILSDKLGLKRALILGLGLAICAYLFLPFIGRSLLLAMSGVFLVFCFYEFTMVTSFSLSTELIPEARATMMAAFYASSGLGRMIGILMGGQLWDFGGIRLVAITSAFLTLLGLVSLVWGLYGWKPKERP